MKLTNPDASFEAKKLFDYIAFVYRTGILSGQQEFTWHCGCDFTGSWGECMNTVIPDGGAAEGSRYGVGLVPRLAYGFQHEA